MALLGRSKKDKSDVPEEIQEYYDEQKQERAGIAWLLAFTTLIVTILLAAGIFFAGRWTYRKITGNKNNTSQTAQKENQPKEEKNNESSGNDASESQKQPEGQGSGQGEPSPNESTNQLPGDQSPSDQNVAGSNTVQNNNIPNTGPGDVLAIFMAVSIFGYMAHRTYLMARRAN